MKIGLMMGWQPGSLVPGIKGKDRNFLGDEMTALSLKKELLKYDDIEECELYHTGAGSEMEQHLDVSVDMNPVCRDRERAKMKIWYVQNGFMEGSTSALDKWGQYYDGVVFAAKKMMDDYSGWTSRSGHRPVFMPIAADEELFYPVEPDPDFAFDVAYCGNDIKRHRTMPFLGPALKYHFGLFGRWSEEHLNVLGPISRGQIDFDDLKKLYSSSKVMINVHFQDCIDWGLWAGRIYDVLLCNGFLITDEPYGLPDDIKKHVVLSDGGPQLEEQLKHYINDDQARRKVADGGREFIMSAHTWKHRAETLHKYLQEFV